MFRSSAGAWTIGTAERLIRRLLKPRACAAHTTMRPERLAVLKRGFPESRCPRGGLVWIFSIRRTHGETAPGGLRSRDGRSDHDWCGGRGRLLAADRVKVGQPSMSCGVASRSLQSTARDMLLPPCRPQPRSPRLSRKLRGAWHGCWPPWRRGPLLPPFSLRTMRPATPKPWKRAGKRCRESAACRGTTARRTTSAACRFSPAPTPTRKTAVRSGPAAARPQAKGVRDDKRRCSVRCCSGWA